MVYASETRMKLEKKWEFLTIKKCIFSNLKEKNEQKYNKFSNFLVLRRRGGDSTIPYTQVFIKSGIILHDHGLMVKPSNLFISNFNSDFQRVVRVIMKFVKIAHTIRFTISPYHITQNETKRTHHS